MPNTERVRDLMTGVPSGDYWSQRAEAGWRLVAIEWERAGGDVRDERTALIKDVPFGLRVSGDCAHLEENPSEIQALMVMMEVIVQDRPLTHAAEELNRRGFRTREGARWSPSSVFGLLPRLIEMGPRIFTDDEWVKRRKHLFQLV